jgi:hypothetical protein
MSARRLKRALSESDEELPPAAEDLGTTVAQAFIAGRIADIHSMGTAAFQQRTDHDRFVERWRDAIKERGGFTGFELSNAGRIDIEYVPGLEEVPQSQFFAFVEIVFSSPDVPLDHDKAFTIGVVVLHDGGRVRIGAIHAR